MTVASLELCAELFELSGWDETGYEYSLYDKSVIKVEGKSTGSPKFVTAYDLGYLFRKLPPSVKVELAKRVFYEDTGEWSIDLTAHYGDSFYWTEDFSTPEDALASLLIRLIKDKDVDDVETN